MLDFAFFFPNMFKLSYFSKGVLGSLLLPVKLGDHLSPSLQKVGGLG